MKEWWDKFVCLFLGHVPRRRFNLVNPHPQAKTYDGGYYTQVECDRCEKYIGP